MRADPITAARVRSTLGLLADDGGASTALQVIAEFLGAGECARTGQYVDRFGTTELAPGTDGAVQNCRV